MLSYNPFRTVPTFKGSQLAERLKNYKSDNRLTELRKRFRHDAKWITSIAIGVLLALAIFSYDPLDPGFDFAGSTSYVSNLAGYAGAWVSSLAFFLIGIFSYLLPLICFYQAWLVFRERSEPQPWNPLIVLLRVIGWAVFLVTGCALATVHIASDLMHTSGGYIGLAVSDSLFPILGLTGGTVIFVLIFLLSLTLAGHISWVGVIDKIGETVFKLIEKVKHRRSEVKRKASEAAQVKQVVAERKRNLEIQNEKRAKRKPPQIKPLQKVETNQSVRAAKEKQKTLFDDPVVSGGLPGA